MPHTVAIETVKPVSYAGFDPLSGYGITCGDCGIIADIELWTATPIGGALPVGCFQCPACGSAIRKREPNEGTWVDGYYGGKFLLFDEHPDSVAESHRLIRVATAL